MKTETKQAARAYADEVLALVKKALASKPIKYAIAGGMVGAGIGIALGAPVMGLYIGSGIGAYQGITAD
jgi:uncharacterized membrane protein